jgi:ribonuclease HIII
VEVTLEQRPRAESNIAVAAASVLARAKFVESLREMSDEYGTKLPKGASAKVDAAAREFVRAFGRAELHKVAKMHFRNAKKL